MLTTIRQKRDRRAGPLAIPAALAALLAVALAGAPACPASIKVAGDAHDARLRVDRAGYAEVDWVTASGGSRSLLITPSGKLVYGGRLAGGDVSASAPDMRLPFAIMVRRTPDGALWALQAWRRLATGPVELRFARWRGEPTRLTLRAVCCKWGGEKLEGAATFQGRPIYGDRVTPAGRPLDDLGRNVYLDSYRGGWMRMMGILTHRTTGAFTLWIRSHWHGTRYRGAIIGPNWGWTLGPDALAETASATAVGAPASAGPKRTRGGSAGSPQSRRHARG